MTQTTADTPATDEPDGGLVAWFAPNGDPVAVFHKNEDDDYDGTPDRDWWYPVDGDPGMSDPLTWEDVLTKMERFDGPHELVRAA